MPVDRSVPWEEVAKVRRSDRKTEIIYLLSEEPRCASELAETMGVKTDTASNYLRELRDTDAPLVECLTPQQPHHRLYALTEDGEAVREHI